MPEFLLHLWAKPPANLHLDCPAPPPGGVEDPGGIFDPTVVASAYDMVAAVSFGIIVVFVLVCYLATSTSLGPRFVRRWYIFLAMAVAVCSLAAVVILRQWPTTALAGSCSTNPTAFEVALPWSTTLNRALAAMAWTALVFPLLSILLTRTAGFFPWSKGLFHNRGCPYPRWSI